MMREKAEGAKAYIERKYAKLKNEEKEKKEGKNDNHHEDDLITFKFYSMGQTS